MFKIVIKYIAEFLHKAIDFSKAKILSAKDYVKHLFCAASHHTYIETVSNKADSLHRRISLSYEEDVKEAFKKIIKKLVVYKRYGKVTLAIDFTKEQFYGKTNNFYIYHCGDDAKSKAEFHYLVISIVDSHASIPLLALPVPLGCDRSGLVKELLEFAQGSLRIKLVLLDREFVSADIMKTMENMKLKYLVFAKKYAHIKKFLKEVQDSGRKEHEMKYAKDKSTHRVKTHVVVVKAQTEEDYDWCFYTNLHLDNARYYISLYKKRWQIETNFRVEDEARIKSKSVHYLVRYFYFMISLLLHALWLIFSDGSFMRFLISEYEEMLVKEILVRNHSS